MGGELLLFYVLPASVLAGALAAWLVACRSARVGWPKHLRILVAFITGLLAPTLLLVAAGSIARHVQPKPKSVALSPHSSQLSVALAWQLRPNPSLERTSTGMALGPRGAKQ